MKKTIFVFASLILALLLLFQISTYYINSGNLKVEFAIAIIAIVFLLLVFTSTKKALISL